MGKMFRKNNFGIRFSIVKDKLMISKTSWRFIAKC